MEERFKVEGRNRKRQSGKEKGGQQGKARHLIRKGHAIKGGIFDFWP